MTELEKLSSVEHWESEWKGRRVRPFTTASYYDRRVHQIFAQALHPGDRIVEIGCGSSRWLRYFDEHWHAEVWGIDYSPSGHQQAQAQMDSEEKKRRILSGDFFAENALPRGYFDVVYSWGFVEHFSDVPFVLRRCAGLLRPGGRIITVIPNFAGWYGPLQKTLGRDIFDMHHIMDAELLHRYHLDAGLEPVLTARYQGCFAPLLVYWTVCNRWLPPLTKLATLATKIFQQAVCWTLSLFRIDRESRALSPWITGIYRLAGPSSATPQGSPNPSPKATIQ